MALAVVALLAAAGCGSVPDSPPTLPAAPSGGRPDAPPGAAAGTALGPLLLPARGGDGDSWKDTHGVEYRMGLINAPEVGACGGATATAFRKRSVADGFYARVYSTDRYGRRVAVIYTRTGTNLNVEMARLGIADDRYLAGFRHENPALARQLDPAFAAARAARRGIWGSCTSAGS